MMDKSSKSSLFLMELIMSILFFAIAAAVCVQLFVKSHILSQASVELNHAVIECQSAAEYFYGSDGDIVLYPDESIVNSDLLICYYDKDFNLLNANTVDDIKASSAYSMQIQKYTDSNNRDLVTCNIEFINLTDNKTVYSLSPTLYLKENVK